MARTKIYTDLNKVFTSKDGKVSFERDFFCTLPCGMVAEEFSDKKMQDFVDFVAKARDAEFTGDELELLERYQNNDNTLTEDEAHLADEYNQTEFEMVEGIARERGMIYYEDLTDESYEDLMRAEEKGLKTYKKELK